MCQHASLLSAVGAYQVLSDSRLQNEGPISSGRPGAATRNKASDRYTFIARVFIETLETSNTYWELQLKTTAKKAGGGTVSTTEELFTASSSNPHLENFEASIC